MPKWILIPVYLRGLRGFLFFFSALSVLKLTEPKDSGIKNSYKDEKTTANKQKKGAPKTTVAIGRLSSAA